MPEEHPDFPIEDWQYEVACGDTMLGYWSWVNQNEMAAEPSATTLNPNYSDFGTDV